MNGASKILTVSYGTFSCTLEGFDDPFNTMKAIAEYFRDLAAEDRYFGAEPPTPDAAMLHRIAEREIQRRVEAKIGDHGVTLRAEEGVTPKVTFATPAATPAAQPASAAAAPVVTPVAAPQPAAPVLASAAEAAPAIESAAARLSRLRAAQAQSPRPAPQPEVALPVASVSPTYIDVQDYSEDQDLEAPSTADEVAAAAAAKALADQERAAQKEQRRARKASLLAAQAAAATAVAEPAAAPVVAEAVAAEPVAETPKAPEPVAPETVETAAALESLTASIRETLAGFGAGDDQLAVDLSEAQSAPEAEAAAAELDAGFDEILPEDSPAADSALIDGYDQIDAAASLPEAAPVAAEVAEPEAPAEAAAEAPKAEASVELPANVVAETIQRARARVIKIRRLDVVPTAPAISPEAFSPEALAPAAAPAQPAAGLSAADLADLERALADAPAPLAAPLSAEAEADLESELAALQAELGQGEAEVATEAAAEPEVEIEAAEIETVEIETAEIEEVAFETLDSAAEPVAAETAEITAPQMAELEVAEEPLAEPEAAAEVAEAEIVEPEMAEAEPEIAAAEIAEPEIAEPEIEAPVAAQTAAPETGPHAEPHRLPAVETGEAAVNRLLEKANSEFEVPETKRRRSAIAHLKAAVLATVAERRINPNGKKPDAERMDPYRQDLNQVVRPASGERPAPLVLVSSQRIDRTPESATRPQAVQAVQPVRPRRVTSGMHGGAAASRATIEDVTLRLEDSEARASARPSADISNVFADPGKQSFQEFADALGAHSMQDLIEAAGAYCTLVLGQESFTRPLLFRQIESLPGHEPEAAREDGLRGFGRLLRDGRLTKTKRGQYVMAESSPILTEARRQAK